MEKNDTVQDINAPCFYFLFFFNITFIIERVG